MKKMQKRIRRARRETKYFQGLDFKGKIPSGDRDVHVPNVDLSTYEEKLEEGLERVKAEIGIFYANREHGGRSTRVPQKVAEGLQKQADILNELNYRRSRERR